MPRAALWLGAVACGCAMVNTHAFCVPHLSSASPRWLVRTGDGACRIPHTARTQPVAGAVACAPRQIGDVVGYVHGGKYLFNEAGDSTGKSLGADYSAISTGGRGALEEDDEVPRWAQGEFAPGKRVSGELRLAAAGDAAEVTIVNEVRPSPASMRSHIHPCHFPAIALASDT